MGRKAHLEPKELILNPDQYHSKGESPFENMYSSYELAYKAMNLA